jgi:hypothetical protein
MQWDEAGVLVTPVRWYFVPPGTPPLPFPHLYGSSNWDTDGVIDLGPGERWDSLRPYSKGQLPGPQPPAGEFCGSLDWWQNGCPSDAPLLPTNLLGQADCCIQDGGVTVGGTSVVNMHPPNIGGLLIGGTSRISLLSSYSGGVSTGGLSILYPPVSVSGGILIGGTSRYWYDYPGRGGVEVGAESKIYLVGSGYGGSQVGAVSAVGPVEELTGGIQVGATSVVGLSPQVHGGVEVGGTSTHYQFCLPWPGGSGSQTLTRELTGHVYTPYATSPDVADFMVSTTPPITIFAINHVGPCNGSMFSTAMGLEFGLTTINMILVSLNLASNTATFLVPSSSPYFPGELWTFYAA